MKNTKRILAMVFVLVFMFTAVMSSAVLAAADNDNGKGNGKGQTEKTEKVKENGKNKVEGTGTEDGTEETEEEKAVKVKDKVMDQKKVLMKQLIEARKSGNAEAEEQLLTQVKEYKEQLKLMVRNSYTEEEMVQLAIKNIKKSGYEVLPLEKIIAKGRSLKFDLPPVIKDGQVLVPVRAFSQAYGAEVQWNQEEHAITIIKDDVEIIIETDSGTVYVDGVEVDLEMPVIGINGRNVMPVGFLAEKLGLKAEVDPEDGTIEIEEEEEGTVPES